MNGIDYNALLGNTGLFSNQTGQTTSAAQWVTSTVKAKEADSKATNAYQDTVEIGGQSRTAKAGYDKPKAVTRPEYKKIDENGIQEGIKLSDAAKNLLAELKEKYGNMDISVAEWSTDEEQDYYAGLTDKDYSVLINPEALEAMAADESVREQYESILSGAGDNLKQIKEELGEDADKVEGFSITIDKDGKVSYAMKLIQDFAERNAQRAEESEKTQAEKAAEKKKEEKKAKSEKIEADSIEELIAAIKAKLHPEEVEETPVEKVIVTE